MATTDGALAAVVQGAAHVLRREPNDTFVAVQTIDASSPVRGEAQRAAASFS